MTSSGVSCTCQRALPSPPLSILVSPSLPLFYSTVLHLGWGSRTRSCHGAFCLRILLLFSTSHPVLLILTLSLSCTDLLHFGWRFWLGPIGGAVHLSEGSPLYPSVSPCFAVPPSILQHCPPPRVGIKDSFLPWCVLSEDSFLFSNFPGPEDRRRITPWTSPAGRSDLLAGILRLCLDGG